MQISDKGPQRRKGYEPVMERVTNCKDIGFECVNNFKMNEFKTYIDFFLKYIYRIRFNLA